MITNPTGLQVIEALCPAVSRYECETRNSWIPPLHGSTVAEIQAAYKAAWQGTDSPDYMCVRTPLGFVEMMPAIVMVDRKPATTAQLAKLREFLSEPPERTPWRFPS